MGRSGRLEYVPVVRVPSGAVYTAQRGRCCYKRVMDMTTFWVGAKKETLKHSVYSRNITHHISKHLYCRAVLWKKLRFQCLLGHILTFIELALVHSAALKSSDLFMLFPIYTAALC